MPVAAMAMIPAPAYLMNGTAASTATAMQVQTGVCSLDPTCARGLESGSWLSRGGGAGPGGRGRPRRAVRRGPGKGELVAGGHTEAEREGRRHDRQAADEDRRGDQEQVEGRDPGGEVLLDDGRRAHAQPAVGG